uniref:Uncharacterized protein n=1 Tax=Macrostomum lignano TaxID=282301 RepID=A0A1I8FC77_9PLAT
MSTTTCTVQLSRSRRCLPSLRSLISITSLC